MRKRFTAFFLSLVLILSDITPVSAMEKQPQPEQEETTQEEVVETTQEEPPQETVEKEDPVSEELKQQTAEEETDTSAALNDFDYYEEPRLASGAAIDGGYCGDNAQWTLYSDNQLIISGSGAMTSWAAKTDVPWYDYREQITSVIIENGVSDIGPYAFSDCFDLESIVFPGSLEVIGEDGFRSCTGLKSIYFSGDKPSMETDSFAYVTADAYYPEGNKTWESIEGYSIGGNLTWKTWNPESENNEALAADESVIVYDVNKFATYSSRTVKEVAEKYSEAINAGKSYINRDSDSYYIEQPSTKSPYAEGVLTEDTHTAMTGMTDFYRWLVGAEKLQEKSVHSKEMQLGALVRYFDFNHSVDKNKKPADMSDEMWDQGAGCVHNILARGYTPQGAITGWINEGYNLRYKEWDTIGHRFNLIAPSLSNIQFGYAAGIAIGKSEERNNGNGNDVISTFPAAGYMPDTLVYPEECAWTVIFDNTVIKNGSSSSVSVKITNQTTGKTYVRSASDNTVKLYLDGVEFVQPEDYNTDTGQYEDSYQVVITGLTDVDTGKAVQIEYEVNFVDILPYVSSSVSSAGYSMYTIHTSGGSTENLKKLAAILPQEVTVTAKSGYKFTVPVAGKWELDQENSCWTNRVESSALPDNITDSEKILDRVIMKYSLTNSEYSYYDDLTISPSKVKEGEGGKMMVYRSNVSTDTSRIYKITQDSDGSYSSVLKYDSNTSPEFDAKASSDSHPYHIYKIDSYSAKDSGEYVSVYYRSSNSSYIYVSKNIAALTVEEVITLHPQDYTGAVGETAVFTVKAQGDNLDYQWQYCNAGTSVWKNSGQSGNKTSTLNVPITEARDGQRYRCVITDAQGKRVISDEAVLHVKKQAEKLKITSQPSDYTGEAGKTAVFTVKAAGNDLHYQWEYQNAGSSVWKSSGQSGNKTDTLKVPVTEARNGQKYRCVITDGSENRAISKTAVLYVGSSSGTEAVKITGQPKNYTGAAGETAVFTVTAAGNNMTYQWQYQNVGSSVWRASGQSGNKTNTLSVPITEARNGQKYRCTVTDGAGNQAVSDAAVLYVGNTSGSEAVKITGQPKNYTGAVGETAVFTVTAEGTGLSYQWEYQNAGSSIWRASGQTGNNTDTLKVPITAARNGQKYRCTVTDANGNTAVSNAAAVNVKQ